jgi:hypothetical protein
MENMFMEGYVHDVKMFLCLIDEPGEVHNGRQNDTELQANLPEIWR